MSSFDEPPQTTNQSGQDAQAQSVAQTTANTTSSRTQSLAQMTQSLATQQADLVDPPLPAGSTANVAPGGATIGSGVTFTGTVANPVVLVQSPGQGTLFSSTTGFSVMINGMMPNVAFGPTNSLSFGPGTYAFTAGTVTQTAVGNSTLTIPSGAVTAGGAGAEVTINASTGLVTAINAGTVITGPVSATPYVFPIAPVVSSSSGALAAAPAAGVVGSSPGLAGTAAIQPNVDALTDALSAAAD
jgi:hypothetical protein